MNPPQDSRARTSSPWHRKLLTTGALEQLGVPHSERSLLQDCVACSHWRLVTSQRWFLASRGSRPGDGLADVLFGALFAVGLNHIKRSCAACGIKHVAAGSLAGSEDTVLPLGWADDLAILSDYDCPRQLQTDFPKLAGIAVSTLQALKFRVNLGAGKTEAMLDIRGAEAKQVRREMLLGEPLLCIGRDTCIRVAPEYRYLGVVQTPRDTGRRDVDLCAQRACGAWAHGRNLLSCPSLPWALKQAWIAGRILPAAYATLATVLAVSARSWSPLTSFYEKVTRTLVGSWSYAHVLAKPLVLAIAGMSAPSHAVMLSLWPGPALSFNL